MSCKHDINDKDIACADGMCPLCLAKELATEKAKVEKLEKVLKELVNYTMWDNAGPTSPQQVIAGQNVLKEVEQGNLISKSNTKSV